MVEASSQQRRDSLGRNAGSKQRPRLLRSSATEPSITAPKTIKGSLVVPSSPKRVADILSKMAVYPLAPAAPDLPTSPSLHHRQSDTVITVESAHTHATNVQPGEPLMDVNSGNYELFSTALD